MLTIRLIKKQLKMLETERMAVLETTKNFTRLFELNNLDLLLNKELVKLLEIQLNKKHNLRNGV